MGEFGNGLGGGLVGWIEERRRRKGGRMAVKETKADEKLFSFFNIKK